MALFISNETIERTKCKKNFHCLDQDPEEACEALDVESNPVVITVCRRLDPQCDYCKRIDDDQGICTCPTRIERYIRYGF